MNSMKDVSTDSKEIRDFLFHNENQDLMLNLQRKTSPESAPVCKTMDFLDDDVTIHRHQFGVLNADGEVAHVSLFIDDKKTGINCKISDYYEQMRCYKSEDESLVVRDEFGCIGTCRYYYPNGNVAGIEIYDNSPVPEAGIYFTPDGQLTTQSMADVHLREEYGCRRQLEFLPRFKEYNLLVDDLKTEYLYSRSNIDAREIRELILENEPKAFLDMLARDVKNSCHEIISEADLPRGYVDALNSSFVYGSGIPIVNYAFEPDFIRSLGINDNFTSGTKLNAKGKAIERLSNPSYNPIHPSLYHVIYKDCETNRMMAQEMIKDGEIHYQDIYYKDGKPCLVRCGKEDFNPETYDCYGRICDYGTAMKSLQADWGFESLTMELKYDNKTPDIPVRLMNAYKTGFDENILLVKIDGIKIPPEDWDSIILPKGEHDVRIHLNTTRKILVPKELFKDCNRLKSAKLVGKDVKQVADYTKQFDSARIKNNMPKSTKKGFGL